MVPEGVQARAAAVGFVEGGAEVAEAVVADGHGRLGDVALAGAEELRGAFQPDFAEVLLEGLADVLGEEAAEVEGAATDAAGEVVETGGFLHVFAEDGLGVFHALALGPFGAGAEEFAAGGLEEELGGEFGGLAGEPDPLGGLEDGGMAEALGEPGEFHALGVEAFDVGPGGAPEDEVADHGMKGVGQPAELAGEERGRELHGDELVALAGLARGGEWRVAGEVEGQAAGLDEGFALAVMDPAGSGEVEAEFDASGMKAPGPIHVVIEAEVVPLDADAEVPEPAQERSPAGAHGLPGGGLAERTVIPA